MLWHSSYLKFLFSSIKFSESIQTKNSHLYINQSFLWPNVVVHVKGWGWLSNYLTWLAGKWAKHFVISISTSLLMNECLPHFNMACVVALLHTNGHWIYCLLNDWSLTKWHSEMLKPNKEDPTIIADWICRQFVKYSQKLILKGAIMIHF